MRQWVHIGKGAMVGGKSAVLADVLPYSLVSGNPACFQVALLFGLTEVAVNYHQWGGSSRHAFRLWSAWLWSALLRLSGTRVVRASECKLLHIGNTGKEVFLTKKWTCQP